ncbi:MAG: DUF6265 family protein [Bacteroidia bacterium]
MKKVILFTIVIFSGLCSCSKKQEWGEYTWLEGKWTGTTDGTVFFEEWQPLDGKAMHGIGGAIVGNDTVFSEQVSIEEREDGFYYIAAVQENKAPVSFKFTGYKNDSMVFENPQHDFPQRIVYFRRPDGTVYACVDGKNFGKYNREEFNLSKLK